MKSKEYEERWARGLSAMTEANLRNKQVQILDQSDVASSGIIAAGHSS